MARFLAVLGNNVGEPQARLAEGALRSVAARAGHEMRIERAADQAATAAPDEHLLLADCDESVEARFAAHAHRTSLSVGSLILDTAKILEELSGAATASIARSAPEAATPSPVTTKSVTRIVAVTSCPTGIAHTFMAAAALKNGAAELGCAIKVETRGSVGAQNTLTDEEIAAADVAIVAADTHVDLDRFAGTRLFATSTNDAIHDPKALIARALKEAAKPAPRTAEIVGSAKPAGRERTGAYKHLMTGVSHMLPLVIAGGLLIALAFAVGGIHAGDATGTLGWALMQIGGATAFKLYVPVLAGFIAFSIADRPGLAPGLVGGMLSASLGAGFLGGIAAGFLAGYLTRFLNERLPLPATLQSLKPILILPLLSTLLVGLAMIYVIGSPVKYLLDALTGWLSGMQQSSALVLGLLLGAMMAFDLGGPVNKAAYTFGVGLLASNVHGPMAAVMAGGMTPPLGIALACLLFPKRFSRKERGESRAVAVLGLSFISEGAIPFAATDPLRIIPSFVIGSAVAGAISMATGTQLMVPHGGVFVLFIPHAVAGLLNYVVAITAGTFATAIALRLLKRAPAPEA